MKSERTSGLQHSAGKASRVICLLSTCCSCSHEKSFICIHFVVTEGGKRSRERRSSWRSSQSTLEHKRFPSSRALPAKPDKLAALQLLLRSQMTLEWKFLLARS